MKTNTSSVAAVYDRRTKSNYATVTDRRYKLIGCFALLLTLPLVCVHASPADDQFQSLASTYIDKYLEVNPEQATQLGDHRFDDRLSDYSADALAKELTRQKEFREKLNSLGDESQLSGANRIDFQILRDNVDYQIFQLEELKEWEWNPLVYNQSLADSLYLLVARDFAPAEKRIPNLKKRMEAIPTVIAQAEKNLKHPPRVHTETAIDQTQGAISLVREGLSPLLNQAPQLGKELAPLQEKTAKALEDYKKWLEEDLLPRSNGNFRIGAEKFRKKLHFALASDLSTEEIMKRARADLAATQKAIYETALPLYKKYFPDANEKSRNDKRAVTKAVLEQAGGGTS